MELCIDTSSRWAGIALAQDGVIARETAWHSRQNHTMEMAPAIERLLKDEGLPAADLTALIVAIGPGNFSALRTGLGLAKGLAHATGVALVPVGTLEIETLPYLGLSHPVCPLMDAGRGNVAWAVYQGWEDGAPRVLIEEQVSPLEDVLRAVPGDVIFCGEGLDTVREELRGQAPPGAALLLAPAPTRRLSALASLGCLRLSAGHTADAATLQPRYLRGPAITKPKPPQRIK